MKAIEAGYDAGANALARGDHEQSVLWRRAFTAYCEGVTLREIASMTGLNENTLKSKAYDDGWPEAKRSTAVLRLDKGENAIVRTEQQIARIRENRERNLGDALQLRNTLLDIVTKLQAKTLTVKKVFCSKGVVTEVDVPPGPGDLVNIATFARTVADLTYRALGDHAAESGKTGPDASASTTAPPAGITVILPAVAVEPRQRRARQVRQAVDVESSVVQEPSVQVAPPAEQSPSDLEQPT